MTLISAAAVVLLPGLAASWWTVRRVALTGASSNAELDSGQRIGLVYSGIGVACICLWLGASVFGLSRWMSLLAPLAVAGVLALAALRGKRSDRPQAPVAASLGGEAGEPAPRRNGLRGPVGTLALLSLISVAAVALPFSTYGWERPDGVHRMAMTDWEKHLVMTTAIAASARFPPPHPYLHTDPNPSYYFGYHLVAGAIEVASGRHSEQYFILLLLTLTTAAATPFVVYTFARDLCARSQAVLAAAGSTLLVGFDLIVVGLETLRATLDAWPLPSGLAGMRAIIPSTHIDFWIHNVDRQFNAPIITTMWAPHQTAATLIALLVLYLLAPRPDDPMRPRSGWLLPALLLAALPALSAYVALGLGIGVAAAAMAESIAERRAPWHGGLFRRWAPAGAAGLALALPILPTLTSGSSSGLTFHISPAGTWSNGALWSWLFGPRQWTGLLDSPAVYLMELGVVGLLAGWQIVRLWRARSLSPAQSQAVAIAFGILLVVTVVRPPVGIGNNLYARTLLLVWFVLAPFAAMAAYRARRSRWLAAAVLVCALGTAYAEVGYLLEGGLFWGTPRDDVAVLSWINDNSPPASVVAIRPGALDGSMGYWLRRPMVLGDRRLALLFGARPQEYDRTAAALEQAYSTSRSGLAAKRFDDLEADIILVSGALPVPAWAGPPCFETVTRNDAWLVLARKPASCTKADTTH